MAQSQMSFFDSKNILVKPLETVMHESMMPYSEYVILDRALPRVEDGLKPVQRRVLYAMNELGLTPDKPYLKSARIVGDCLGKYHPHGDTSVYDAMVRMAQDFVMSAPLIDGQGNFGSVDGDTAAAMRYTEARLTPLALEMLRDLDEDTCKWSLNYDDKLMEPDILPSRFPNILVNGANGIAVGLATSIPPHNLAEVIDGVVMLIDNPKTTLANLMQVIKGPDFPTGAYVSGGDELYQAYETGRGKLTMRAKMNIETADNDKKSIVITEFPYQVNKSTLQVRIQELRETKKDTFAGIQDIVDESDRTGMRVVVKLRKDANADLIIKNLLKYTDLQKTFGVNMVAIANGKPCQMGIIEILNYYIDYQREFIVKRTQRDLKAAKKRVHVLEGLLVAIQNIDAVIKIIKNSQSVADARANLRSTFGLSEEQAQAILEMQLRRLTSLEVGKLEEEIASLHKLIEELSAILASKKLQMKVLKEEILDLKKQHKTPRRTQIIDDLGESEVNEEALSAPKKSGIFCVNTAGVFKLVSEKNYSMASTAAKDCTESEMTPIAVKVENGANVYAFSNLGNCFRITNENLPEKKWREKGSSLQALFEDAAKGEKIVSAFSFVKTPNSDVFIYTKDGAVKRTAWEELVVSKGCYQVMSLKDKNEVVGVEEVLEDTTIFFGTKQGICLNCETQDISKQGRTAGGVRGITLNEGDSVLGAFQTDGEGEIIVVTENGYAKRVISAMLDPMTRARKGVKIAELDEKSGSEVKLYSYVKEPFDLAVLLDDGTTLPVYSEDISIESRTVRGKPLYKGDKKVKKAIRHFDKLEERK